VLRQFLGDAMEFRTRFAWIEAGSLVSILREFLSILPGFADGCDRLSELHHCTRLVNTVLVQLHCRSECLTAAKHRQLVVHPTGDLPDFSEVARLKPEPLKSTQI
jgi:hypothetical protein